MSKAEREQAFREWLESLDPELRAEVPHDLLALSEREIEDCKACREFLESFRSTVQICRETPPPAGCEEAVQRAAAAAREELRAKGLL